MSFHVRLSNGLCAYVMAYEDFQKTKPCGIVVRDLRRNTHAGCLIKGSNGFWEAYDADGRNFGSTLIIDKKHLEALFDK